MSLGRLHADTLCVRISTHLKLLGFALALAVQPLTAQHGASSSAGPVQVKHGNVLVEDLDLHVFLAGLRTALPPRVINGNVVLSVSGPYRVVAAVFEHEGYAELHPFDRNKQGVFVFAYPVPLSRREPLLYRLVIDGAWTVDPLNPRTTADVSSRVEVSVLDVPYLDDRRLGAYKLLAEDGRTVRFLFRAEHGKRVAVYGDFDNWDPFIHELIETEPGVYSLDLPLPEGTHRYAFVYEGEVVPDPLNPRREKNAEGKIVSVVVVGPSSNSVH